MKIYVGCLSPGITDKELRGLFSVHGRVESVEVVRNESAGDHSRCGFVCMPCDAAAKDAITALDGRHLRGLSLEVKEVRHPGPRRPGWIQRIKSAKAHHN